MRQRDVIRLPCGSSLVEDYELLICVLLFSIELYKCTV